MSSCEVAAGSMLHHYPSTLLKILFYVNMDKNLEIMTANLVGRNYCFYSIFRGFTLWVN